MIGLFLVLPSSLLAADSCDCWCGKNGEGAQEVGKGYTSPQSCIDACVTKKLTDFSACVPEGGASPAFDLRCWSPGECASKSGTFVEEQPAQCVNGYHFCKPGPKEVPLSIHIGSIEAVLGIGGYIAAVYTWLMGAAAVFAVLMFTIGALMYMLSAGKSDLLAKGKDHMKNALIGFVLLLSTFLILQTVNPQTLSLQIPTIPMIRSIPVPGESIACESFYDAGYTLQVIGGSSIYQKGKIDGAKELADIPECGTTRMKLVKNTTGRELSGDQECYFTRCPEKQACSINTEKKTASCVSDCKMMFEATNVEVFPAPSKNFCGQLSKDLDGSDGKYNICIFVPVAEANVPIQRQSFCGDTAINCEQILRFGCRAYDNVNLQGRLESDFVKDLSKKRETDDPFATFCSSNICGVEGGCGVVTVGASDPTCKSLTGS